MKTPSQLYEFTRVCLHLASQHVPPHFSKFSKHTFTQPQLVVLVCLKLKLGVTYREPVDWLAEMPGIQQALGLKQLPHFTTGQKAFARLSPAVWRVVQRASSALLPGGRSGL